MQVKKNLMIITVSVLAVVMILSLLLNYVFIRMDKNVLLHGSGIPHFIYAQDGTGLLLDGCFLLPKEVYKRGDHEYQNVKIKNKFQESECLIVDAIQVDNSVQIYSPKKCIVKTFDVQKKMASIIYEDVTISVDRDKAQWETTGSEEKRKGEFVDCKDNRLNWNL